MKKTKAAIMNAKVADAQRAVARLSRKDAETQVTVMHVKEQTEEHKVKVTPSRHQYYLVPFLTVAVCRLLRARLRNRSVKVIACDRMSD